MDAYPLSRRSLVGAGLALATSPAWAREPANDITAEQDFDELWETLRDRYCFFHEKATDWHEVRKLYRPMAASAESLDDLALVYKRALSELYDTHTGLHGAPDGSSRNPPYDLIVDAQARVQDVQPGSAAEIAGVRIGDIILASNGEVIAALARDAKPRCLKRPDPAADLWAVNVAVSGKRAKPRVLSVRTGTGPARDVALPVREWPKLPDIEGKRLDGGIGYIAIRSFAEMASIDAFDAELAKLADAPALIIDVRGNGGGDTAVARPIMGRFIHAVAPYARMRRRQGQGLSQAWTEVVEPRGPFTYERPVVVLTNAWSGSMAEGFPMGMRGLGRAVVVGRPMMGLGAAVFPLRLDRTGFEAQYSAEPVYDVNDRPRWLMRPDVELAAGSDLLAGALVEAKKLAAGV